MTYDFSCKKCLHVFEVDMKMSELGKKKVKCPKCHTTKTKRVYANPAPVQFNGSGFYINDKDKK